MSPSFTVNIFKGFEFCYLVTLFWGRDLGAFKAMLPLPPSSQNSLLALKFGRYDQITWRMLCFLWKFALN